MKSFWPTLICFCLSSMAFAAPMGSAEVGKKSPETTSKNVDTKQEHNFEDLLVQGKYHFSEESVTTVEEDKVLDSLLGVRSEFKDRMEKSAGQY